MISNEFKIFYTCLSPIDNPKFETSSTFGLIVNDKTNEINLPFGRNNFKLSVS